MQPGSISTNFYGFAAKFNENRFKKEGGGGKKNCKNQLRREGAKPPPPIPGRENAGKFGAANIFSSYLTKSRAYDSILFTNIHKARKPKTEFNYYITKTKEETIL